MNTISNPKKVLFVAIFLVLATFLGGSRVEAQVSEPATTAQVEELKSTLIALLTQMIAGLQAQIAELLAQQTSLASQQASTTAAITQLSQPVLGAVKKATTARLNNIDCIVHAPYEELNKVMVPLIVDGEWKQIRIVYDRKQVMAGYNSQGYAVIPSNGRQKEETIISSNNFRIGNPWFEVYRYPDTYDVKIGVDNQPLVSHVLEVKTCEI